MKKIISLLLVSLTLFLSASTSVSAVLIEPTDPPVQEVDVELQSAIRGFANYALGFFGMIGVIDFAFGDRTRGLSIIVVSLIGYGAVKIVLGASATEIY